MAKRKATLPEELLAKLRNHVPKRKLSQYIAEATATRLAEDERGMLRKRLKEQYLTRAAQDRELAEEFFAAEQEASERIED
jgi:hypothetical protein